MLVANTMAYLLSGTVTAWLLTIMTGLPLYLSWRKKHKEDESDTRLIRYEVLGRTAQDGLPAQPALSAIIRQMGTELRADIQDARDAGRKTFLQVETNTKALEVHEQRLNAQDLKIERINGRLDERTK